MIKTIADAAKISRQLALLSRVAREDMTKELAGIAALYDDPDPVKQALYYAAAQEVFISTATKHGTAAQAIAYNVLESQQIQLKTAEPVFLNAAGIMDKAISQQSLASTQSYLLGALDQSVKRGYRQTIHKNAERWARVPVGSYTCPFCVMLASRGFVYATEKSAGSSGQYHAYCDCALVPSGKKGAANIDGYDPDKLYDLYKKGQGIGEQPNGKPVYSSRGGGSGGGSGKGGSGGGSGSGETDRFEWSGHTIDVSKTRSDGEVRVRIDSNDGTPPVELISRHDSFSMSGSGNIETATLAYGKDIEKETAAWATQNYGGSISLVKRRNDAQTPDYIWNGEKWEQKSASSINGIQARLEKAAIQTDNGSVILDVSTYKDDKSELLAKVGFEMMRQDLQVIIIRKGDGAIDILEKSK
jgi:uncharacterized membrane protein YgcG